MPLTARPPVRPIHPQCSHRKRDSHYGETTSLQVGGATLQLSAFYTANETGEGARFSRRMSLKGWRTRMPEVDRHMRNRREIDGLDTVQRFSPRGAREVFPELSDNGPMVTLTALRSDRREEILPSRRAARRVQAACVRFSGTQRSQRGQRSRPTGGVGSKPKLAGPCRASSRSPGITRYEGSRWNRKITALVRSRQNPARGRTAVKDDRLYLHHLLERCQRITRFVRPGRDAFMASDDLQDAVIRNVEVIGEAAKRVSEDARSRMASLDWTSHLRYAPRAVPRVYRR